MTQGVESISKTSHGGMCIGAWYEKVYEGSGQMKSRPRERRAREWRKSATLNRSPSTREYKGDMI